jgi:hypothetical protein
MRPFKSSSRAIADSASPAGEQQAETLADPALLFGGWRFHVHPNRFGSGQVCGASDLALNQPAVAEGEHIEHGRR